MATIQRNQPCPCGSGTKDKKCCFLRAPAVPPPAAPQSLDDGDAFVLEDDELDALSNSVLALLQARRDALTNGWRDLGMTDASGSIGTVRSYLNLAFDQIQAEHESEPGMDTLVPALREGLDCWMRIAGQFDVLTTVSAMSVTPGHLRSESIQ